MKEAPVGEGRQRRIAMVAYTHYATDPRCRREAELCLDAGWEVDFFALRGSRGDAPLSPGLHLVEMPMDRYRGGSAAAYVGSYLRFLLLASGALLRRHLFRRYAVVHVNTMPDFMVLTALVPRLLGARVILDVHDVMPEIYMTKFGVGPDHWKIRLLRCQEVWSARIAHAVLTAEHPKAELLAEHGVPPGKIRVLLNLPDERIFPERPVAPRDVPDAPGDPFRVVYHGTVAHRLGLDLGIAAVELAWKRYPGMRYRILGDGDQLPELRRLVAERGLDDVVGFTGRFLPVERILPELMAAHLALIPTRPAVSTDYMLPTKLIEYLQIGVPSLVTPTRTVRWYFGEHHPLYLEDTRPEAIAGKLIWARENYGEVCRLAADMREEFLSRYRWREHGPTYLALLDELAGGDARG